MIAWIWCLTLWVLALSYCFTDCVASRLSSVQAVLARDWAVFQAVLVEVELCVGCVGFRARSNTLKTSISANIWMPTKWKTADFFLIIQRSDIVFLLKPQCSESSVHLLTLLRNNQNRVAIKVSTVNKPSCCHLSIKIDQEIRGKRLWETFKA